MPENPRSLEATTFALYGNASWSNRDVAPLVADGATAMTVDFTFMLDQQRWSSAVRLAPSHALDPDERDALVREDITAGLLSLA